MHCNCNNHDENRREEQGGGFEGITMLKITQTRSRKFEFSVCENVARFA